MGTPWSPRSRAATGTDQSTRFRVGRPNAWKMLKPASVPRAIEKTAATVWPRASTVAGPPDRGTQRRSLGNRHRHLGVVVEIGATERGCRLLANGPPHPLGPAVPLVGHNG